MPQHHPQTLITTSPSVQDFLPSCSLDSLRLRADIYRKIRDFFDKRGVLEVETPLVWSCAATDVGIASVQVCRHYQGGLHMHYLQTSPEFAMKRLLAAGSGAIYQICKVFRDDEHGRRHNSEFTMLEWYRPNHSLDELMGETKALINMCLGGGVDFQIMSYKEAFYQAIKLNPFVATHDELKQKAWALGIFVEMGEDKNAYLDLLFSHQVEPNLGRQGALFLTDFPAQMASLAKVATDEEGFAVARRFELYIDGLELANAYDELADGAVLRQRFELDNQIRAAQNKPIMPIDEHLLQAVDFMPPCSGIALGIDRLLMIVAQAEKIGDVLSFDIKKV